MATDTQTDSQMALNKVVKLNVGGVKYATSLATLRAVENSYLTALFSDRWERHLDDEGAVFLDRDGEVGGAGVTSGGRAELAPPGGRRSKDRCGSRCRALWAAMSPGGAAAGRQDPAAGTCHGGTQLLPARQAARRPPEPGSAPGMAP